ncbi:hypothetical protein PG987_000399 [Apiospora arundinis]
MFWQSVESGVGCGQYREGNNQQQQVDGVSFPRNNTSGGAGSAWYKTELPERLKDWKLEETRSDAVDQDGRETEVVVRDQKRPVHAYARLFTPIQVYPSPASLLVEGHKPPPQSC